MIEAWSDEMGDRCDCRGGALCGRCLLGWHQYDRYVQRVMEQQQRCALSRGAFRLVDRLGLPTDQLREWTLPGCWRIRRAPGASYRPVSVRVRAT
jgi:hypothetical protein